jgi:peptidyl-prolyl cis-trans isomerase D
MLQSMRNATKNWIAYALIGLLILSFAIWGIADIFTAQIDRTVATVGGEEIQVDQFEERLNRVIRQEQRTDPTFDRRKAVAQGLDREVLDAMMSETALLQEAKALGIGASDRMVRDSILEELAGAGISITDAAGNIDPARYADILQRNRIDRASFEQEHRQRVIRQQMQDAVGPGGPPPVAIALAVTAFENERRTIEYAAIPAEAAGEIAAPEDAALELYMKENAGAYTAPEFRTLSFVSAQVSDFLASVPVKEEDIAARYEARKAEFVVPEKRTLTQLAFESEADARAARKLLDEGKSFDEVAAGESPKATLAELGEISKPDAGVFAPAFDIAEGEVTQPFQNQLQRWILVRAATVTPPVERTLDDMRQTLRDEIAMPAAREKYDEAVNLLDEAYSEGLNLEQTASKAGLKVRTFEPVDAQGNGVLGLPVPGLPGGRGALLTAFAGEAGDTSDLQQPTASAVYVVRIDAVTPPALRALAEMRGAVADAWTRDERAKRLLKIADEAAAKGAAGADPATVLKDLGVEAKSSEPLARDAAPDGVPAGVVEALFKIPMGPWVTGKTPDGGAVIARVTAVTFATPEDGGIAPMDGARETARLIAFDTVEAYTAQVKAAHEPVINEEMLRRLANPTP